MKFGEKLKELRKENGLSQSKVAQHLGISLRSYAAYETEGRYPKTRDTYDKLAQLFHCDRNYLLSEDEGFVVAAAQQYGYAGQKQAQQLIADFAGLCAGGQLSDADRDAVMQALQEVYWECKSANSRRNRNSQR